MMRCSCFISVMVLLTWTVACTTGRPASDASEALRVSQWAARGDAQRQASTRMVLEGLRAGGFGREIETLEIFERAIQVDPSNPLAYLAYARQEAFHGDPTRALEFLDKAEASFGHAAQEMGAVPHLQGLRGVVLQRLGQSGSSDLLAAARQAAGVWADGRLDATELR